MQEYRKSQLKGLDLNNPESIEKYTIYKQSVSDNGKFVGQLHIESGHIIELGTKFGPITFRKLAQESFTCNVCGYHGQGRGNNNRWHGKNCTYPLVHQLLEKLSDEFTWKDVKQIAKENNIPQKIVRKLILSEDFCVMIHRGTNGSSIDVSVYKKIPEGYELYSVPGSQKESAKEKRKEFVSLLPNEPFTFKEILEIGQNIGLTRSWLRKRLQHESDIIKLEGQKRGREQLYRKI